MDQSAIDTLDFWILAQYGTCPRSVS